MGTPWFTVKKKPHFLVVWKVDVRLSAFSSLGGVVAREIVNGVDCWVVSMSKLCILLPTCGTVLDIPLLTRVIRLSLF